MSRLYLRIHLALLGSLIVFAAIAALLWHVRGGPAEHGHSLGGMLAMLLMLAAVVGGAAYPIVRYLVRRLERLQQGAEVLAAGDLSARVIVEGHDEVARLATSFNRAAARIEQLVGAHKMLLAQASHELRTPLTRIRLALDLSKDIDPKRRQGLEADIAELDRLIEEILLASRLDTLTDLDRDARRQMPCAERLDTGLQPLQAPGEMANDRIRGDADRERDDEQHQQQYVLRPAVDDRRAGKQATAVRQAQRPDHFVAVCMVCLARVDHRHGAAHCGETRAVACLQHHGGVYPGHEIAQRGLLLFRRRRRRRERVLQQALGRVVVARRNDPQMPHAAGDDREHEQAAEQGEIEVQIEP
jgi:HAMP domain-containing protein